MFSGHRIKCCSIKPGNWLVSNKLFACMSAVGVVFTAAKQLICSKQETYRIRFIDCNFHYLPFPKH